MTVVQAGFCCTPQPLEWRRAPIACHPDPGRPTHGLLNPLRIFPDVVQHIAILQTWMGVDVPVAINNREKEKRDMSAQAVLRRNPVSSVFYFVAIVAALLVGASAGYAIKPASVMGRSQVIVVSPADQPSPGSQPCAFRSGTKGC